MLQVTPTSAGVPNFPAEEVALRPASPESPLQANVIGRFRWRFVGGEEETVIPARTGAALLFWRLAGRESLPMWGGCCLSAW